MRLILRPSPGNQRGPIYTEQLLCAWWGMMEPRKARMTRKDSLRLLIGSFDGEVGLAMDCPDLMAGVISRELQDAYPGLVVESISGDSSFEAANVWTVDLRLSPDVFSLRRYESFVDDPQRELADPLAGLLSAIRSGRSGRVQTDFSLSLRPASGREQRRAAKIMKRSRDRFLFEGLRKKYLHWACDGRWSRSLMASLVSRLRRPVDDAPESSNKAAETLFACQLRVECRAPASAAQIARKRLSEMVAALGRFTTEETRFEVFGLPQRSPSSGIKWLYFINHLRSLRPRRFLLSAKEIATLWHVPTENDESVDRLGMTEFKELAPPVRLPSKEERGVTVMGRVTFRRQRDVFGIRADDLRRHMLVLGKTGCGKSTFLASVVRQQMECDRGVVLIDPHGQLFEDVLDFVPKRRTNDIVLFDAGDRQNRVTFNPLSGPAGCDPTLVADSVLTAFKKVFGLEEATAPRLLHIFRHCLLTLVGQPNVTLRSIQRLLSEPAYRRSMISTIANEAVRDFWLTEFNRWSDRDRTQYIASLQNKLGAFTSNECLQQILCSTGKGIDLRSVLDHSQILLCNLSKGRLGHDASSLLGSLLLSSLQLAAMSRADVPEEDRPDATIVLDEFHSFLADGNTTMADALAESRKYRTSYVLAAQMFDQLDDATLAGVLGNCGSTLCMTVGPRDADTLCDLLGSGLTPADLMNRISYRSDLRDKTCNSWQSGRMNFQLPSERELSGLVSMMTSHGPQWIALALIGTGDIAYEQTKDADAAVALHIIVYTALHQRLPFARMSVIDDALDELLDERQPVWYTGEANDRMTV